MSGEKKNDKKFNPSAWVVTSIVLISSGGIIAILLSTGILIFGHLDPEVFTIAVESTFIEVGLSVIGCAIAVWAGVSIVNAIERKDIDAIKENLSAAEEQLAKQHQQQREYEKNLFISELLKSSADLPTKMFAEQMQSENAWDCNDVSYNDLLHIEQLFSQVYSMHEASDQKSVDIDKAIQQVANDGIEAANNLIGGPAISYELKQFLYFRIAEFNFYKGYHAGQKKRGETPKTEAKTKNTGTTEATKNAKKDENLVEMLIKKVTNTVRMIIKRETVAATEAVTETVFKAEECADNPFVTAIGIYEEVASLFGATIPIFDDRKYNLLMENNLQPCEDVKQEISAYLCNTLGVCYSKIFEQARNKEKDSESAYKESVFYCFYAVKWNKNNRERYARNYGCALEHAKENCLKEPEIFEKVRDAYSQSLYLSLCEGNVGQKPFKVWLSLYYKYCVVKLGLCLSQNTSENNKTLSTQSNLVVLENSAKDLDYLLQYSEDARMYAHMAVTKYPDNLEFLKLQAFVYRNLAIIFHLRGKGNEAKDYFNSMDKNIENLKRICPNDTYDTYMRMLTNLRAPLHDYIFKADCDEQ